MPKDDIDYSNTIIYKIFCNDKSINDVYVGHTTNFTNRKHSHKRACCNLNNKLKIYNTIRQNGGWDNWNMVEIAKYNCSDNTEARIKEQQHYEELNSNLNSRPPYPNKKLPIDQKEQIVQKEPIIYSNLRQCSICNFTCYKKSEWDRHNNTAKHKTRTNLNKIEQKTPKSAEFVFVCQKCNKGYNARNSLWYHNKKCKENAEIPKVNK